MDDKKENINLDKRLFSDANIALNSQIIPQDSDAYFIILKDQIEKFINDGQYKWVVKAFKVLETSAATNGSSDLAAKTITYYHSPQFISLLINSFRKKGRENREEAHLLCEYLDEKIISPLIDALNEEESHYIRSFFVSLIIHFDDKAIPRAIKHLNDNRWFVKRNMLYILYECGNRDLLLKARPYCNHKNPKVSFEAVKCLLKAKDAYAVEILHRYLRSKSRDIVMRAISLSGAFRVKDVVPELIQILKNNTIMCKDINDKLIIIRALCQIGDPDVFEMLRGVLSSNPRMFKGSFEKLKNEIYGIVKNCSNKEAQDLLTYCENQENSKKRTKAEKTLARLSKKLAVDAFRVYRRSTWLYMSILMVIAVILVVMSFNLLRNNNRTFQLTSPDITDEINDTQKINASNQYVKELRAKDQNEDELTLSRNAEIRENEAFSKLEPDKANIYKHAIPSIFTVGKDENDVDKAEPVKNIESTNKLVEKLRGDDKYVSRKIYTIQLGSFTKIEHAQHHFESIINVLNEKELDFLRIEKFGKLYAVRLGYFEDYADAKKSFRINKSHLSSAMVLNAYIKGNRIIKLYKPQIYLNH
jgi:HEAT repeat protein